MRSLAPLVLLLGCDVVLGIESLPPGGPFRYVDDVCHACTTAACETEEAACANDPACAELYACLVGCPTNDGACRNACTDLTPPSEVLDAMESCRRGTCRSECIGDELYVDQNAACEACIATTCAAENASCADTIACDGWLQCRPGCTDPRCVHDCIERSASPSGVGECVGVHAAVGPAIECWRRSCAEACGYGATWSCVGDYQWGALLDLEFHRLFTVREFQSAAVPPPHTLSVCTSGSCVDVVDNATTNDDGEACLTLNNFSGVGFTGFVRHEADDYTPALYNYGRPVTRSVSTEAQTTTSAADSDLALEFFGVQYSADRGSLNVTMWDCLSTPAVGVTFELSSNDPDIVAYYNADPIAIGPAKTNATGTGGFFNVPAGDHVLTVRFEGERVAERQVYVLGGGHSNMLIFPLDEASQ